MYNEWNVTKNNFTFAGGSGTELAHLYEILQAAITTVLSKSKTLPGHTSEFCHMICYSRKSLKVHRATGEKRVILETIDISYWLLH